MRFLRVRNFEEYQHYKDRNPPWIKLYNAMLDDYEIGCLPDASKWLAVGLLLLASRHQNHIPADPKWIAARLNCTENPDIDSVLSTSFLEVCACDHCAIVPLAEGKRSACLEKRREETETENRLAHREAASVPAPEASDFERWWQVYPRKVGKRAAMAKWKQLRKAKELPPVDDLIAATERLSGSPEWSEEGGKYIPHPTTWLNRGGWGDQTSSRRTEISRRRLPDLSAAGKSAEEWLSRHVDELTEDQWKLWNSLTEGYLHDDEELRTLFLRVTGKELPS